MACPPWQGHAGGSDTLPCIRKYPGRRSHTINPSTYKKRHRLCRRGKAVSVKEMNGIRNKAGRQGSASPLSATLLCQHTMRGHVMPHSMKPCRRQHCRHSTFRSLTEADKPFFKGLQGRAIPAAPCLHSALLSLAGSRAFILVLQGIELISHRQRHRAGGELIIVGLKHRARVQSAVAVIRS